MFIEKGKVYGNSDDEGGSGGCKVDGGQALATHGEC